MFYLQRPLSSKCEIYRYYPSAKGYGSERRICGSHFSAEGEGIGSILPKGKTSNDDLYGGTEGKVL
jgi:hypothetical protein